MSRWRRPLAWALAALAIGIAISLLYPARAVPLPGAAAVPIAL